MKVLVVFGFMLVVAATEGVIFTRCQLVKNLRYQGFPEHQMRDWVCLVEHESSRNTNVVGPPNRDGSRDYGLFQINDRYWCSNTGAPGKECNLTCSALLTDDISKASMCAKKIFQRQGFNAWSGWKNHCEGKTLPDIRDC